MDIQELQSFRLSDAVKFNDKLNPRLWGSDEHLLPDVREKLMAIADDFREFLGISDLEIKDITVSGSNAAYTYTPHSDIDLHLVVDLPKADISEVYKELFNAKKYQYNDQHDYKIGNYDIELYVQDANKPHHSQGIYSVLNNEWVRVPSRRMPKVDDISVKSKFEDIGQRIEQAVASGNKEQMDAIAGKIKNMRQAGLDSTGEFGPENLAFKALRTQGLLDQLSQARAAAKDAELSITERKKARNKKPSRWGTFGGQWFPGYHNYGQATSEIGDGNTDGGTESVAEDQKPKDIKDILPPFIKSCAQYLGLEKTPKIILKRDPEWTRRNGTFGRFDPDTRSVTLAVSGRHTLDILRTLAHELTHARQDELATMPVDAGETGSPYEDDANAQAGRIMRYWVDKHPEFFKDVQLEDYDPNGPPPGPESKPTMPAGTVKVDVSDVYDWYKLGQHISNLKGLGQHDFGQGPPSAILSFGSEEEEHKYIQDLEKTGLTTTDIDPVDPNQPKNIPRQKTDPTYNVTEAFDQPYELLRWEKGDFGDVDAIARLDDGTFLSIMFNKGFSKDTKEETWSVEFWRNNSQEVTGEGDQQRVFATVLSAIQQFIDTEHPAHIRFSANKDVDPGQKSQTRSNLYNKLVQRYANSWGYSVDVDDFADTTVYNLYTLHESVTENTSTMNFEEGDCPIFAIALHRLSKLPLMALVEYDEQIGSAVLIHAYVKLDNKWRIDATGETDVNWMLQKYPNNGNAEEIEISEKDLIKLGYGKNKCPMLQQVLPHAKEVLQTIDNEPGLTEGNDFDRCFDQACKLYDRAVSKNLEPKLVQVADFQGDGNGADPRWMKLPQHVWQHYVVIVGDQVLDPTAKQFGDTLPTQYRVSDLDRLWGKQYQIRPRQGVAEGLDEAVGDNYLYHATMPAGLMRILRTGAIKATDRPQPSTKARTQYPTISTTRSKQYAESNDFVDFLNLTNDGNAVILVFDRNAVANHYKMFGTSQGTQTVGDEFEEVIVAPRGSMPIRGTLKGFYFNPNRTAEIQEYQDVPWFQELLTSPYYMGQKLNEATGFIPVDSKLAHDPRYVSGLTVDIKPGETQRQAKKLGWKIDKNGSPPLLMQELERQWNIIKESREELDEINMRPSNLKQLSSDVAGAQAGMEFEMIVPDVEGNDDYDEDDNAEYESDYEYNTDANSINEIVEFFSNEEINSYYAIKQFGIKLREAFDDWVQTEFANRWQANTQEFVYDYVKDNLSDSEIAQVLDMEFDEDNPPDIGRTEYNLAAEKIVDEQIDPYYEDAEIDARDVFMSDDDLESEWLQSEGYETMQDIESNFDINWPHQNRIDTSDGPGSQSIKDVALNFMNYMGFETIAVGDRWHDSNYEKYDPGTDDWEEIGSEKPLDCYTVEPDGSLTARSTRDRGLEFVSPPMPLDKMLDNLNRVKAWAKKEGCYTGKDAKTGLHINVSVPGLENTKADLDYVKLALLLGDEYVSKEFGRLGEHYAQSALKKVKEAAGRDPAKAAEMLNIMRGQMSKLASKIIQSSKVDKFTSIHPKEGYVEFRSPGGDWLDGNFSKIEPTLMRFIVALDAAAKPEAYREEYLKKLYRLLDPEGGESKGLSGTGTKDTVRYFADFVAGKTPQAALRSFVKQAQLERKLKRGDSEGKKYWWKVSNPGNSNASIDVVALSKNEAIEKAIGPDGYPSWSSNINSLVAKPLRPYEEQSAPTPKYEIYNKQTGNTVEDAEGITNDRDALIRLDDYIHHGPHRLQSGQARDMFGIRQVGTAPIRATAGQPQPAGSVGRAQTSPTGQWKIVDGLNREVYIFRPAENTRAKANELAALWARENDFDGNYQVEPAEEESSTPAPGSTTDLAQQRATPGTFTGAWKVTVDGEEVYRFSGIGNNQTDANRVGREWARNQISQGLLYPSGDIEVLPIMS